MTDNTQPEALRLAEQYDYGDPVAHSNMWKAAVCNELRRLHAENERLSGLCDKWNSECDEFREDNKRLAALVEAQQHTRIAELEAELEAVGAGGVQALSAAPAQAAPAPLSDDVVKDSARYRWLIDQHWIQTEVDWRLISTDQDSTIKQLDAAIDAALAAQGGQ